MKFYIILANFNNKKYFSFVNFFNFLLFINLIQHISILLKFLFKGFFLFFKRFDNIFRASSHYLYYKNNLFYNYYKILD